jgi:glycosyltransferase involved in cell wall biosynthesis
VKSQSDVNRGKTDSGRSPVVLHILPEDGPGGAELAARSAAVANGTVHLLFLKGQAHPALGPHERIHFAGAGSAMSATAVWRAIELCDQLKPDIVVFSLWRSWLVMTYAIFRRRSMKYALLLHCSRSVHWADFGGTSLMSWISDVVLSDSHSSLARLGRHANQKPARVLSFLRHRPATSPSPDTDKPNPTRFMYWGRIAPEKDLPRAIRLFSGVRARMHESSLLLVGPDAGAQDEIVAEIAKAHLKDSVSLLGMSSYTEISAMALRAHFFLQLSRWEGMAMSVAEAMQLGLVPIVTPVGEIAHYCRDGKNAIIVHDDEEAVARILEVIADPEWYSRMSDAARETFAGAPTYPEDFMMAASEIVAGAHDVTKGR